MPGWLDAYGLALGERGLDPGDLHMLDALGGFLEDLLDGSGIIHAMLETFTGDGGAEGSNQGRIHMGVTFSFLGFGFENRESMS